VARERPRGGQPAHARAHLRARSAAVDSKHFINPNGLHDINTVDKFENLLVDQLADGTTINAPSTIEQRAFATFLKAHKNVVAYFHGHTNYTQYYDWNGPDGDVVLHAIRVDSPMKGNYSATDETQLSFEMVSIDTRAKQMTVRECLWNKTPKAPAPMPIVWASPRPLARTAALAIPSLPNCQVLPQVSQPTCVWPPSLWPARPASTSSIRSRSP